ncbi:hypothetical protein [Winogradskyella sp.]|uniref:hypothetical protein n=1 Tax=Winogradskyella sp. TaxID=1883156 RepID=UPI003F6971DA
MKQNLSLSLLIENWKKFLNIQVNESISGKEKLKVDSNLFSKQNAEDFIELFVKSRESGLLALSLLNKTLDDYQDLKTKSLDSRKYIQLADDVFNDPTTILTDSQIDNICSQIYLLIKEIELKLGLKNGTI